MNLVGFCYPYKVLVGEFAISSYRDLPHQGSNLYLLLWQKFFTAGLGIPNVTKADIYNALSVELKNVCSVLTLCF